jgi:hypothetical protein
MKTTKRGMHNYIDITGQRFGRLTAIVQIEDSTRTGHCRWLYLCDCGRHVICGKGKVAQGQTKSCGCLRRELSQSRNREQKTTHGLSGKKLYNVYYSMWRRCYDERHDNYHNYGARGIKVCQEWLDDKSLFFQWALENGYIPGLHLDRIDNYKGYGPGNCRWLTPTDSCNNKRDNHRLTHHGETLTIAQWARRTGINHRALRARIRKGWPTDKALTTPINIQNSHIRRAA